VKDIISVVMMAPDPIYKQIYQDGSENDRWFCVERPGFKINEITGYREGVREGTMKKRRRNSNMNKDNHKILQIIIRSK
jgi:hypothetical protein